MKNIELVSFNRFLTENFQDKKVPFSLHITKMLRDIAEPVKKYDEDRLAIIQKYATVDENGNLIGKMKEDGTRIENPQLLTDLEIDDLEGMAKELDELGMKEVEFTVEPLDLSKTYYNTDLKEKSTVEEYIDTNLEPGVIAVMNSFGMIKL